MSLSNGLTILRMRITAWRNSNPAALWLNARFPLKIRIPVVFPVTFTRNPPDVPPKTLLFMAQTALDPLIKSAKLKPADFKELAGEILQPSQLPARTRYSYTALRCLRINQGVEMSPLAASNQALTKCATSDWVKLGKCVADATQPVKH